MRFFSAGPDVNDTSPRPDQWSVVPAGATPMMEQYIEIKAANPDSLLFYRMNRGLDFFPRIRRWANAS